MILHSSCATSSLLAWFLLPLPLGNQISGLTPRHPNPSAYISTRPVLAVGRTELEASPSRPLFFYVLHWLLFSACCSSLKTSDSIGTCLVPAVVSRKLEAFPSSAHPRFSYMGGMPVEKPFYPAHKHILKTEYPCNVHVHSKSHVSKIPSIKNLVQSLPYLIGTCPVLAVCFPLHSRPSLMVFVILYEY